MPRARKAEQALFDVHHRIVDRGRPRMAGPWVRARAGTEDRAIGGVVSTADAAGTGAEQGPPLTRHSVSYDGSGPHNSRAVRALLAATSSAAAVLAGYAATPSPRQVSCLVVAALSAVGAAFTRDPESAHITESDAMNQAEQQRRDKRKILRPLTRHNVSYDGSGPHTRELSSAA